MVHFINTVDPDEGAALAAEFKGHSHYDIGLADRAFKDIAKTSDINNFLEGCPLYDTVTKRWCHVPINPKEEGELHGPLCEIFTAVIEHFGPVSTIPVSYIDNIDSDTNDDDFKPKCRETSTLKSTPDISFEARVKNKATPNNFEFFEESNLNDPGYRILVSPMEVTLQRNFGARANQTQAAVYARLVHRYLYGSSTSDIYFR